MPMRLEAGEQRIIPDIVAALRQQGVEGIGPSRGFYAGAVFATAEGGRHERDRDRSQDGL